MSVENVVSKNWKDRTVISYGFSKYDSRCKSEIVRPKYEKNRILQKKKMKLTGVRVSGCVAKSFPLWSGIRAPGDSPHTMSWVGCNGSLHLRKLIKYDFHTTHKVALSHGDKKQAAKSQYEIKSFCL